jgi:hypothetical protein
LHNRPQVLRHLAVPLAARHLVAQQVLVELLVQAQPAVRALVPLLLLAV